MGGGGKLGGNKRTTEQTTYAREDVTSVRSREQSVPSTVQDVSCRHIRSLERTFGSLERTDRVVPSRRFARKNSRSVRKCFESAGRKNTEFSKLPQLNSVNLDFTDLT